MEEHLGHPALEVLVFFSFLHPFLVYVVHLNYFYLLQNEENHHLLLLEYVVVILDHFLTLIV
jgi:hypothetical protein